MYDRSIADPDELFGRRSLMTFTGFPEWDTVLGSYTYDRRKGPDLDRVV